MGIIKADAQNTTSWEVADKKRGDFKMDKYVCDLLHESNEEEVSTFGGWDASQKA